MGGIVAIAGVVITFAMGVGTYYVRTMQKNQYQQMEFLTANIASQIGAAVEMLDEISLQLSNNVYVTDTFSELYGSQGQENAITQMLAKDAEMQSFMWSYILKRSSVYRICLLNGTNDFTYVGTAVDYQFLQPASTVPFAVQLQADFAQNGKEPLYHIDPSDPYLGQQEESVFTVCRQIHDSSITPARVVGYVQVQYLVKNFGQYYDFDTTDLQGFLLNSDGDIILSYNGSEQVEQLLRAMPRTAFESAGLAEEQDDYIIRCEPMSQYGLTLVLVQDQSGYRQFVGMTVATILLAAVLIILIALVVQYLLVRRTTQPIADLCEVLENLDPEQNFSESLLLIPGKGNELVQLNQAFATMMKNLQRSMAKTMAAQVGEIQSHMLALQAQMNPHFIHNTMAVISAMADEEQYGRIPEVCQLLSEMIRYSSDYDDSMVSVQQELNNAINYLKLMKLRYEDNLGYTVMMDGEDREYYIPKFIFQPLVENFFKNGTKNKEFPWQVSLHLYTDDAQWYFEVQDNGNGADDQALQSLREKFQEIQTKDAQELMRELRIGGLSISNILIRLSMLYGPGAIFEVRSPAEGGFFIKIGGMLYQNPRYGGGGRTADPEKYLPEDPAGGPDV